MDILIIRKSGGLGDIICCEPVIRGLRKKHPHAKITCGMPHEFVPLFQERSEAIFKGYQPAEFTVHWMRRYLEMYDIVVNLCGPASNDEQQGSPECSRTESFCNFAGVPASRPEIHLTEAEQKAALKTLKQYPKPWIGIGPNGTNWTRNWPEAHWAELIEKTPGTKFYFDLKRGPAFKDVIPFVGKPLRELAAVISILDLMVTVDTGLLHLAGAVKTKTFSLWGPSDPRRTLKHYSDAYYISPDSYRAEVGCEKPCLYSPVNCRNVTGPISKCMEALEVEEVISNVNALFSKTGRPAATVELTATKAEKYEPSVSLPRKGKKARIVWVSKHLLPATGGAERSAVELIKHLSAEGYEVMAFWSHNGKEAFKHYSVEMIDGIVWAQTPPGVLPLKMLEVNPDIVLTQLATAPQVARAMPKVIPLFIFLRSISEHFCQRINSGTCKDGTPIDLLNCPGCDDEAFLSMKTVYRVADEVIANSEAMASIFEKFTGREAKVQYPVVDYARCETGASSKEYCVAIGVTEGRGADFLSKLAVAMPEEKFLWVGSQRKSTSNIEVVSAAEDLKDIFSKAFLNLTPHKQFQAFGRTPAEAGWAGIPSLTLNNGGLPEAVGKGGLVLGDSISEWQSCIQRLRKNPDEWQSLSEAARRHAESFNYETLLAALDSYIPRPIAEATPVPQRENRNGGGLKILLVSHNNLFHKTRGGEKSMFRIMQYLRDFGYNCHIVMPRRTGEDSPSDFNITRVDADHRSESWTGNAKAGVAKELDSFKPDVVLTWSSPSMLVKELCAERNIPYVLFVRTLPKIQALHSYGCLDSAAAIITNCQYTSDLLKTKFSLESVCSYVPSFVPKTAGKSSREYLTIIGAEKAREFLGEIAPEMQDQRFLVVDYSIKKPFRRHNVRHVPYRNNLTDIWSKTDILLFPAAEDMSGTSHTTMEAMIQGIPAIAQDRASLAELNFLTVPKNAGLAEWKTEVEKVQTNWQSYSDKARQFAFENHDPRREMERVRRVIEDVMPSKGRALIRLEEGVGNIVESLPTVEAIRSIGYKVDAVIAPTTADTAELISLQPYIDNIFLDDSRLMLDRRMSLTEAVPDLSRYDVLLSCHRTHGFEGIENVIRRTSSPRNKSEREWYMAMARKLGYDGDTPKAMLFCERVWKHLSSDAVAFVPGAVTKGWALKRWGGYEVLAEHFEAVVLLGHEKDVLPKRRAWMADTTNLIGQLSLSETASVLSQSSMFIGHDSGLAHIAAAIGIPTYVIFGPTSHVKNLPEGAVLIRKRPQELCQPCQYTPKFLKCHDRRCLNELTADDVFAQIDESLRAMGDTDAPI